MLWHAFFMEYSMRLLSILATLFLLTACQPPGPGPGEHGPGFEGGMPPPMPAPLKIKAVVVTMFEMGEDTGDKPGAVRAAAAVGAHTSQRHDHEHHTVFLFPICFTVPYQSYQSHGAGHTQNSPPPSFGLILGRGTGKLPLSGSPDENGARGSFPQLHFQPGFLAPEAPEFFLQLACHVLYDSLVTNGLPSLSTRACTP